MTSHLTAIAFDVHDPSRVAEFWARLLGREVVDEATGPRLPGTETQVALRFRDSSRERLGPNRIHLHVTSEEHGLAQTVETALAIGAAHLDVGQLPEEGHVVLSDPGGNEFCVIPPGTTFLAGCGLLGEVACDGTRAVGQFWASALDWPLVWDQDEETAVQSPAGGTKVAWGGPPLAPRTGPDRQRFELTPTGGDQLAEVERLVVLGARRLTRLDHGAVELADPDGNEFHLLPA